jgi:hypothetical protein
VFTGLQVGHEYPASFPWPTLFPWVHGATLTGMVVLLALAWPRDQGD